MRGEDYLEYIKQRNETTKAIRRSSRGYEKEISKSFSKHQKEVSSYMKSCPRVRSMIPSLRKKNRDYTSSHVETAETLADQYNL